jgi:tetratricopeptide (TPR) repeat protein
VFYLAAAWCYVKFDEHAPSEYSYPWGVRMSRPPGWYLLALAFFVLGLLTKTVTATLPAALLVVFWWKRGRLSLARDVLPLAPWFAIGASAGLVTAWSERVLIGAQGAEFAFGVPFRIVLAGRVVWFYLGKLLWPSDLMFFYPRWAVDPSSWVWWTYPVAVVATAALLLAIAVRTGRRAPLAAFLLFVGTLFPALGFLNVYPFRFSYVADHFQYLAGLGILALVSAVLVRIARRGPAWRYPVVVVSLTLIATLGVLARKQSDQYGHDAVYHYRTMIRQNPDVWLAYGNLGWLLSEQKQYDEAMRLFRKALELNPRHFESIRDLGLTYLQMGKPQEAAEWFTRALEFDPDPKAGENRLGNALVRGGRAAEAIPHLQRAIAIATSEKTTIPLFHLDLGLGYRAVQRYDEAIAEFERARTLAGGRYPLATAMLADTQVLLKRYDEAVPNLRRAIDDDPDDAIHRFDRGRILFNARQFSEARPYLEEAIRLRPDLVDAYIVLAMTRFELGDRTDAREIALNGLRAARSVLPPEAVQQIERTLAPILNQ